MLFIKKLKSKSKINPIMDNEKRKLSIKTIF